MSAKLRVGFVGAGAIGQSAHVAHYAALDDVEIAGLAELRPELRAQAAALFGIARTYQDHRELLAAERPDAVVVVVRRPATGPVALDALECGAHVLTEKPMAMTVDQAERLVRAARDHRRCYAIGYMKRCDTGVERARALLDELRTREGPPRRVRAWSLAGDAQRPADGFAMTGETRPDGLALWPPRPDGLDAALAAPYETFLNVHSHLTNLLRFLLGAPLEATEASFSHGVARTVEANAGGVPVRIELDERTDGPWREGAEFTFGEAELRIDLPSPFDAGRAARVTVRRAGADDREEPAAAGGAFARQARAFVDAVRGGGAPPAPGWDAIDDLRFAEAVFRRGTITLETTTR